MARGIEVAASAGVVIAARESLNWRILLLAVAACATTATQFRFNGWPLGPGEILIVVWLAIASFSRSTWIDIGAASSSRPYLVFWLFGATALAGGAMSGHVLGHFDPQQGVRDALAFVLVAATSVTVAACAASDKWTLMAMRYIAVIVLAVGLLLAAIALTLGGLGGINFWYQDIRLSGWAQNPNQLALLFVPLPFMLFVVLAGRRPSLIRCVAMLGVAIVSGGLGLLTRSDALLVAWLVGGTILLTAGIASTIGRQHDARVRVILSTLLVVVVLLMLWIIGGWLVEKVFDYGAAIYESGSQGSTRLRLWTNGLSAAAESPFFGLGPGPHSGMHGPHEAMEAHNSVVDWLSMTGIVGGLAGAGLLGWLIATIKWTGQGMIVSAGLISTLVFSLFGFVLRQPIFWIYLVVLSAAAGAVPRTGGVTSRIS